MIGKYKSIKEAEEAFEKLRQEHETNIKPKLEEYAQSPKIKKLIIEERRKDWLRKQLIKIIQPKLG